MEPDFKPVLITDIVHEIRPAFKDFGFKLKETSDNGFVLFIPFWGDAYKFSNGGKLEWKASFNSKSLSENKERINNIMGTTPDFDVFDNRIYFLQSNESIFVYDLKGNEIRNFPIDIPGLTTENIEVLNEVELIVGGIMVDQGLASLNFFKIDVPSNTKVLIKKIDFDAESTPILVNLNSEKAHILGDRDSYINELDLVDKSIEKIDFTPSRTRDYNKYSIPNNVDYFSLTEEEKRQYRNDKTKRFVINGSDILIFHEIVNRGNDIDQSYNFLLTKHGFSKGGVNEKFDVDWGIDFDECGNIFHIENMDGDYFIVRKTWEEID
ncbi:hypothetical protein [Algoriphagus marinus]|uniref:hypothetical protein n=1 Tax=Algoriphagus marinus TaxID=1925762 RepID=UPI000AB8383C|nr:hypothetical protein [Algoriphagus marinus]